MQKNNEKAPYKRTEKWWLGLVVIFYLLYNLPGVPPYKDAAAALWHGALTIVPLWIIIYFGLFRLMREKKIRDIPEDAPSGINAGAGSHKEGM